jgi:hypothetical protein
VEGFFYTCCQVDTIELKELLLRRYHSLDFIEEMELIEFVEFVNLARNKENEDKLWQQWCAMLPQFLEYKTFESFKDDMTGANIDMRPADVIIKEIEELHKGVSNGYF